MVRVIFGGKSLLKMNIIKHTSSISKCKNHSREYNDSQSVRMHTCIFWIYLRRAMPESRSDPQYSQGCFGRITNCHYKLRQNFINGDRLAFLQGGTDMTTGKSIVKVAFITPPLNLADNYMTWNSEWTVYEKRPLKFNYQFPLIEELGDGEFRESEKKILELINPTILTARGNSKAAKIANCVRNLHKCLKIESNEGRKFLKAYTDYFELMRSKHKREIFIQNDSEAY